MALGVGRTEHAGYLTGADGQKEYENKGVLKWASRRKRRQTARTTIRRALDDYPPHPLDCAKCAAIESGLL